MQQQETSNIFSEETFNEQQIKDVDLKSQSVGVEVDSDDQMLTAYHKLLEDKNMDDISNLSHLAEDRGTLFDNRSEYNNRQFSQNGTVKSLYDTGSLANSRNSEYSVKSLNSQSWGSKQSQNKSIHTTSKEKRRYFKQEQKKIKKELKDEEKKIRKQISQEMSLDGKKRKFIKLNSSSKRKRLSKKTLELLSKKFDDYYAFENNFDFRGPKMSLKEIGNLFEMGASTAHKLYTEWLEDPQFYERISKQSKNCVPERKVTLERLEHVARLIRENPFLTQNQLTVQLNKIGDLKYTRNGTLQQITRTTVARLLKLGKFKKKRVKCVPKEKNTAKSLVKRKQYCTLYKQITDKKSKVYFLDESGFNLYMTRDKAWAKPNQEITVNCPISKGKRFSLIAIISDDGLTHWRIIEGTYRKYEYLDFVRQLFSKLAEQSDPQDPEQPQKWLILDNCAIHDRQLTVSEAKKCAMNILYLPPYSPQLNPIENWFHEVKSKVRKINYSGQKQLLQIMNRTLNQYENQDFTNYFYGIMKHVEKGINGQKF